MTFVKTWCVALCARFHVFDVPTMSHSYVAELSSGSCMKSYCPWSTLCPISMFSSTL